MYTINEIEEQAKQVRKKSLKKVLIFLLITLALLVSLLFIVIKNTPKQERTLLITIESACMLLLVFSTLIIPEKKYKETNHRL